MGNRPSFLKNVIQTVCNAVDVRAYLPYGEFRFLRILNRALEEIVGLLFVATFAFGICLGTLYFGKALWFTYSQTLIGREFLKRLAEECYAVERFYGRDLLQVCTEMNLTIVIYSIQLAVICRCTYLKTIFYDSKGIIGKAFFWVLPFSATIGCILERSHAYELSWTRLLLFTILPSALLLNHFMECAARVIPDGLLLNGLCAIVYRIGFFASKIPFLGKREK